MEANILQFEGKWRVWADLDVLMLVSPIKQFYRIIINHIAAAVSGRFKANDAPGSDARTASV